MPSFGQKLKLEREKRAITLDQISSSTKIGTRMLQAMEEDNFDQLPGGVFNKGFVRAYARHVGLDEEQTVADYLQASGHDVTSVPESAAEPASEPRETSSVFPRPIPWGGLAAGLLAVAVALFVWSHWRHKKEESTQSAQSVATAKTTPTPAAEPASKPAGTAPAPPFVTAPAKTANPLPKLASSSIVNVADRPAAPGEFKVVIVAREDSWLSIQVDNNPAFEDMLFADNQRAVHGRKQVVIKAGNVGGLDFLFDGNKLPSQGDLGEVKTLTFGVGGLQPKPSPPSPTQ